MRKRSGGLAAETESSYLKLAKLAQKNDCLFYSDTIRFNDPDLEKMDYPILDSLSPPNEKSSPDSCHCQDNSIFDEFEFSQCNSETQLQNDEINCILMGNNYQNREKKILQQKQLNIMILGDKSINKKNFLDSCFEKSKSIQPNGPNITNGNGMTQEYCLDLIVK